MSGYTDSDRLPAAGFEVVEAVRALIDADTTLRAALGGAGRVFGHRTEFTTAETDSKSGDTWKRVVVREPVTPEGPRLNVARTFGIRIDVMVEVQERTPRPDQFLDQAHRNVFEAIVGQTITLNRGAAIGTVHPLAAPSVAAYDSDDHSFYSTASFVLAVQPT